MDQGYEVVVTPAAKKSITNILRYIRSVSDLEATVKVNNLILKGLEKIRQMPTFRRVNLVWNGVELRRYEANKRYFILYEIQESEEQVGVYLVRHVRMSKATILSLLEEE